MKAQQVLYTVLIVLEIMSLILSSTIRCKHPPGRQMRRIRHHFYKHIFNGHDSFGSLNLDKDVRHFEDIENNWIQKQTLGFTENTCPTNLQGQNDPCPFYYVLDVDEYRIPKVILQAKCKCVHCLEIDGFSYNNTSPGCVPVTYNSRVLRVTGCSRGIYRYAEVWEPVSVACSCMNRQHQGMQSK